jgi:parallel beta-helix repeat protein
MLIAAFLIGAVFNQYLPIHIDENRGFEGRNGNNQANYLVWNDSARIGQIDPQEPPIIQDLNSTGGAMESIGSSGDKGAEDLQINPVTNLADSLQPINNPSYIIHTYTNATGVVYAAQNVVTGLDEFTSSDSAKIIDNVISNIDTRSVYIDSGLYILDSQINITHPIEIYGNGNSTVIKASDNTFFTLFQYNQTTNCYLHNLTFDGNNANNQNTATALNDMSQNLVNLYKTNYTTIEHCLFKNSVMHALNLWTASSYNTIDNNAFLDNGMAGKYRTDSAVLLFVDACFNTISNNFMNNTYFQHIYLSNRANHNLIIGNHLGSIQKSDMSGNAINLFRDNCYNIIQNNDMYGRLYIYSDSASSQIYNKIIGNTITRGSSSNYAPPQGIFVINANYTVISENHVVATLNEAIRLKNSSNCLVSNNEAINGGLYTTNTISAFYVESGSCYNTFNSNEVYTQYFNVSSVYFKYGYQEATIDCNYNVLTNFNAWDAATAGILTAGPNTKVSLSYNGTNSWIGYIT